MLSRYLALIVLGILLVIIIKEKTPVALKLRTRGVAFLEGIIGGLIIDSVGVNLGYYFFPRQPIYSTDYFAIVLPCWGIFGMLTNLLWEKLGKEKFIKGLAVSLPILFAFYEGTNLITGSWVYTVPFYWVSLGWIPLVLTFVGCHRRRKVVKKIDDAIDEHKENFALCSFLKGLRVSAVIVMFPLLLASLVKLISDLPKLRDSDISVKSYLKASLLMS